MGKFYLQILWSAITEPWDATDRAVAATAVALFFIGLFNQKAVEGIVTAWSGLPPWGLPIGLFVFYRVLRANHRLWSKLERQVKAWQSKRAIHEWIGRRLQDAKKLCEMSTVTDEEILDFQRDFENWVTETEMGLEGMGLTSEAHLFSTADSGCVRLAPVVILNGAAAQAGLEFTRDVRASCSARLDRYQSALREILKTTQASLF